ncbi:hypothetical protein [Phenylobacterium sp.]|jgi:hypothetical protein|uniref:hypothetical protein n=1 Tax=Phenylobacterium sp. TaxID=1871053 RepID=UPI002E327BD3|nr:hypothetical protein [Phenylobacterium sp.]HEX4709528.1 hypothetical protein [Phenylobacterium sp.]
MNMARSLVAVVLAALIGVAGTMAWLHRSQAQVVSPTFRAGIMSTGSDNLHTCQPFTAANHPTRMIQVELPGTFDPRNLQPVITQMDITAAPWTSGNPPPAPYNKATPWSPKTRLDLDLDLGPAGGTKPEMVLIKIIVDDPTVKFRTDGFAIAASDANGRSMFCQFSGGFGLHDATFGAVYYKPHPNQKTMGSYNIGLILPDADPAYILPIFIDPVVQNNG